MSVLKKNLLAKNKDGKKKTSEVTIIIPINKRISLKDILLISKNCIDTHIAAINEIRKHAIPNRYEVIVLPNFIIE